MHGAVMTYEQNCLKAQLLYQWRFVYEVKFTEQPRARSFHQLQVSNLITRKMTLAYYTIL